MRRREPLIGAAIGAAVGLLVVPIIEILIRSTFTHPAITPVFGGALLAVSFFASSAIVAAIFQNSSSLVGAMIATYGTKIAIVLLIVSSLTLNDSNLLAFVVSMFVTAPVYLIFQTVYLTTWRRKYRKIVPST